LQLSVTARKELTQVLRDTADALERVAPVQFAAIGTRALDLDALMINAQAAAMLPELMARFRVVSATRKAQTEPYLGRDWAGEESKPEPVRAGLREAGPREVPQDRFYDRVA
jgi:hypothetical protein